MNDTASRPSQNENHLFINAYSTHPASPLLSVTRRIADSGCNLVDARLTTVGRDVSVEEGYEAAKLCTLNCLRATKTLIGSLDNVAQVVKVLGMVNVAPDFDNTPAVIHGCSDLLIELFGEAGRHARSAVAMTIPAGWACEIEIIFEVKA